ncbi:hypothetical protein HYZ99_05400 [Candidatus Peregrinibacteria bacterium]|nr:hypothetical protein [Candidatus Peregrinibacteria bacterium]
MIRFWTWYERNERLYLILATALFALQLIHLYWLTTDVALFRLLGESFFQPSRAWELLIIAVDYTEIPALISTSLIYVHDFQKGKKLRSILFLLFLNSQWLHIFWITDEFVVAHITSDMPDTVLPHWLAWVAILIDYLELPVIVDTMRRVIYALRTKNTKVLLREFGRESLWRR